MKEVLFIYNPNAGKGIIKDYLEDIKNIFHKSNYEVTEYPTKGKNDARRKILEDGKKFDRIVVAGGDGTFHETVEAASEMLTILKKPVFGYIPTGTVCDFAKTHNIPKDIVSAAKVAISDNVIEVDTGKFNDDYFSYVAAFGIATEIAYETSQSNKNKLGVFAYLMEALKDIDFAHFIKGIHNMEIKVDDETIGGEFIFGAISNSKSIAGLKNFNQKDISLNDGIFEGIFIRKPKDLIELEKIKKGLLDNNFNSSLFEIVKGKSFKILSDDKLSWTLDGEDGGKYSEVDIKVLNNKIKLAVPSK